MKRLLTTVVIIFALCATAFSLNISGDISVSDTWTTDDSPVTITGDATILSGVTITIDPNVTVKLEDSVTLTVIGALDARGTAGNTITFTRDDAIDIWTSIYFHNSGSSTGGSYLEYCNFSYATIPIKIESNDDPISIENCGIIDCSTTAINLVDDAYDVMIDEVTIGGGLSAYGIYMQNSQVITIQYCTIITEESPIYIDGFTNNNDEITITHNSIYDFEDIGIYVRERCTDLVISYNHIYDSDPLQGSSQSAIKISTHDSETTDEPLIDGVNIEDNILSSILATGLDYSSYGLYIYDQGEELNTYNVTIENNTINENAYGIYCHHAYPDIKYNTIMDNQYTGINLQTQTSGTTSQEMFEINNNRIINNGTDPVYPHCGIYISHASTGIVGDLNFIVENNVITDNSADGFFNNNLEGEIINNTVSENGYCGVYNHSSSDFEVMDCIITGNGWYGIDGTATVTYCDVWNNTGGNYTGCSAGTGCISSPPLFFDTSSYNYWIHSYSPCVDTGDPAVASYDPDGSRNDMGAYGGPGADTPNELGGTISSNLDLEVEDAPFWVSADVTVQSGYTLTIDPDVELYFDDGCDLDIDGTISAIGTSTQSIIFKPYSSGDSYSTVLSGLGTNSSTFEYCKLNDAYFGLYVYNSDIGDIENCAFIDCESGLFLLNSDDAYVSYCSFDNCDLPLVYYNGDGGTIDHCEIEDCEDGMDLSNLTDCLVQNCTVERCDYGMRMGSCTGGAVRSNHLLDNGSESVDYGLRTVNSTPSMRDNEIQDNEQGMLCQTTNGPVLYIDSENDAANCITVPSTSSDYPIYVSGDAFPYLHRGHNDIVNFADGDVIYDATTNPDYRYVKYNYWGGTPVASMFYPLNNYDFSDYDTDNNSSYIESYTPPSESELMWEAAFVLESAEDFELAEEEYMELIESFPDSPEAIASIQRLPVCRIGYSGSLYDLESYLNTLAEESENNTLSHLASENAIRCITLRGDYSDAISVYDDIIENPISAEDAICAMIDRENVLMLLAMSGPGTASNNGDTKLLYSQYKEKINELAEMLLNGEISEGTQDDLEILPDSYGLMKAYPNPFNATAQIQYKVKQLSSVNITVYSVTGEEVCTLEDGIKYAGEFRHTWDANGLASGVYFIKYDVKPINGGSSQMSVNKILLVK